MLILTTLEAHLVSHPFDRESRVGQTGLGDTMFSRPTDLAYRRRPLEAVGFYLIYLFVFLALSASVYFLIFNLVTNDGEFAFRVSRFVGGLAATVLSMALLQAKNLTRRFSLITIAFLSGIITLFFGGFFGLLIPAYLSTR